MTGINPWNNNVLDYAEARFNKYKQTAEKFRIIQVGICIYNKTYNDNKVEYIAKPYNFYVFPEDNSGNNLLNCETQAIIFNRDHNMDFNKWIYKGIPYMNVRNEKMLLENVLDGNINIYDPNDKLKVKNVSLFREEDKTKYEEFRKNFVDFIGSDDKNRIFEKYPKYFLYYIMNNLQENVRKQIYFSYESLNGYLFEN